MTTFRLPCSVEAHVAARGERPALPVWLDKTFEEAPHKIAHTYWTKLYWATPWWLDEAMVEQMRELYEGAKPGEHVDHIVPLKSPLVCGLHVPWNLQRLPADSNMAKSNRMWPGHPHEPAALPLPELPPHQMRLL